MASNERRCINCGKEISGDSPFCDNCGKLGVRVKPPKQKTAVWQIVTVIVLAVAVAAVGFYLLYTHVIAPAQQERVNAQLTVQTPEPVVTPTPTPQPTPEPTPEVQIGFDFTALSYAQEPIEMMAYGSADDLDIELQSFTWMYTGTTADPDAQMINGGYVDIAADIASDSIPAFVFLDAGELQTLDYSTVDLSAGEAESGHYTIKQLSGQWYAVVSTMETVEIEGVNYEALYLMCPVADGNLVERLALYDGMTDTLIFISSVNHYSPRVMCGDAPAVHAPMLWVSPSAFEGALTKTVWRYESSADMPLDALVDFDPVIIPENGLALGFDADGVKRTLTYDLDTGAAISQDTASYTLGDSFAASEWGQVTFLGAEEGETKTLFTYYYIDKDGYLVEQYAIYDDATMSFMFVSNANAYEPTNEIELTE